MFFLHRITEQFVARTFVAIPIPAHTSPTSIVTTYWLSFATESVRLMMIRLLRVPATDTAAMSAVAVFAVYQLALIAKTEGGRGWDEKQMQQCAAWAEQGQEVTGGGTYRENDDEDRQDYQQLLLLAILYLLHFRCCSHDAVVVCICLEHESRSSRRRTQNAERRSKLLLLAISQSAIAIAHRRTNVFPTFTRTSSFVRSHARSLERCRDLAQGDSTSASAVYSFFFHERLHTGF
ncbi:hypothetical protein BZA77DRAFT_344289 [Pyronema omphalodes]|nr:hypothetical protein BZA77DRAFT_348214 [Pyronema omphalodes]KAI5816478.1 hypothetical protein BZA77DRAFT_344289 [Pyronema omphalodes]